MTNGSFPFPRDPNVERLGHVSAEYLRRGKPKKALDCLLRAYDCVREANAEHQPSLVIERIRTRLALCAVLSQLGQHSDAFLQCSGAADEAESLRGKADLPASLLDDVEDCIRKGNHCLALECEFLGSPSDLKQQLWHECLADGSISPRLPCLQRLSSQQSAMGSTWNSSWSTASSSMASLAKSANADESVKATKSAKSLADGSSSPQPSSSAASRRKKIARSSTQAYTKEPEEVGMQSCTAGTRSSVTGTAAGMRGIWLRSDTREVKAEDPEVEEAKAIDGKGADVLLKNALERAEKCEQERLEYLVTERKSKFLERISGRSSDPSFIEDCLAQIDWLNDPDFDGNLDFNMDFDALDIDKSRCGRATAPPKISSLTAYRPQSPLWASTTKAPFTAPAYIDMEKGSRNSIGSLLRTTSMSRSSTGPIRNTLQDVVGPLGGGSLRNVHFADDLESDGTRSYSGNLLPLDNVRRSIRAKPWQPMGKRTVAPVLSQDRFFQEPDRATMYPMGLKVRSTTQKQILKESLSGDASFSSSLRESPSPRSRRSEDQRRKNKKGAAKTNPFVQWREEERERKNVQHLDQDEALSSCQSNFRKQKMMLRLQINDHDQKELYENKLYYSTTGSRLMNEKMRAVKRMEERRETAHRKSIQLADKLLEWSHEDSQKLPPLKSSKSEPPQRFSGGAKPVLVKSLSKQLSQSCCDMLAQVEGGVVKERGEAVRIANESGKKRPAKMKMSVLDLFGESFTNSSQFEDKKSAVDEEAALQKADEKRKSVVNQRLMTLVAHRKGYSQSIDRRSNKISVSHLDKIFGPNVTAFSQVDRFTRLRQSNRLALCDQ